MASIGDAQYDDTGLGGAGDFSLDEVEEPSLDASGVQDDGELVNGDVLALQAAWITEKVRKMSPPLNASHNCLVQNAPELLPFEEQLVTSLKEMADSQVRIFECLVHLLQAAFGILASRHACLQQQVIDKSKENPNAVLTSALFQVCALLASREILPQNSRETLRGMLIGSTLPLLHT